MTLRRHLPLLAGIAFTVSPAHALPGAGTPGHEGERMVQGYLAMWSSNAGVNAGSVDRFYAPKVVYYGKSFSRRDVLGDKLAYIRQWPQRDYREVPGSIKGTCAADHSLCRVTFEMTWRRVSRGYEVSTGRALMSFDFVPVEGTNKIARESATIL